MYAIGKVTHSYSTIYWGAAGSPPQGHVNMSVTQNLREGHLIRMQNTKFKALNLERMRLNRDDQKA